MNERKKRPDRRGGYSPRPAKVAESNEELIEQYLEWKRTHTRRAPEAYRVWVRRFQDFANKSPEDFVVGDWTAFARSLEGRFAPKGIQFALSVVHNYLRFWHEQYRLPRLPLFLARIPAARAESYKAIEEDEYRLMVEHLKRQGESRLRDLAIIMLLHDTGVRVSELLQLEIDQIEEDRCAVIETEKTVRQRRIFWNVDTGDIVDGLIVRRVNSKAQTDWLFVSRSRNRCGNDEAPLSRRSVGRIVRDVAREVGITRRICPHSFRHAYIHRLAKLGVPDALIAQMVGHSSPHTVAHYTKLSRPEFEEVARKQFGNLPVAA